MIESKQTIQNDVFDIEEPKKSSKKIWITVVLLILLVVIGFFVLKFPIDSGLKKGDSASISYSVTLDNGNVIDEVLPDHPKTIVVGDMKVSVIDDLLIGMKEGDNKKISISPDAWAGKYYDPSKVKKIPKILFDNLWEEVVLGRQYVLGTISGVVISVDGDGSSAKVVLDTNDPKTRQNITYKVSIIEIK